MKRRLIYTATVLAAVAFGAGAQNVEILGFTSGMRSSQIKAKVDLAGKTLAGVTSYSYRMSDGAHSDSNVYSLVDAGDGTYYLSANVDLWSGVYGYFQLRLDFSDGSRYLTECTNPEMSEAFYWLGDIPMSKAVSGWDTAHPPVVDGSVDPGYKITLDDVIYYKGVSNHAPGEMEFRLVDFPLPSIYKDAGGFATFKSLIGVQDDKPDGSVEFVFNTDGVRRKSQTMYSKTNGRRGNEACVAPVEFDIAGTKVLNIVANMADGVNWGDHAQHALARLYLAMPERASKELPTLTFTQETDSLVSAVNLSATLAGAAGRVYYSIVSGTDLATIKGEVLEPVWGKSGEVVVEATYYGDDTHQPASAYLTYYVDLAPKIEILEIYTSEYEGVAKRGYLLVDTKGARMPGLTLTAYDNHNTLNKVAELDMTGRIQQGVTGPQIIPFEMSAADGPNVVTLTYQYEGTEAVTTPYWEEGEYFDYLSDLPVKSQAGWGSVHVNEGYPEDNQPSAPLRIGNEETQYKKGFGIHAAGYVESNFDLTKYHRFAVSIGGQKISNPTRAPRIIFGLQNGNTALVNDTSVSWNTRLDWDKPVNGGQNINLKINIKADGDNTNNVAAICAPRLYYHSVAKPSQTLIWEPEKVVRINEPASYRLDAVSSSGLTAEYRVVKGTQYASVSGNTLSITTLPSDGSADVVVEAYQPGNAVWGPACVATQTYRLIQGLDVGKTETVTIKNSQVLDEVIIHADRENSGQIKVDGGVVNVKKLMLKYTFVPGEWTYISFPSSLDIDKISDFSAQGFSFNNEFGPAYYIQTLRSGIHPSGESAWTSLDKPVVEGMKGYAMGIGNTVTDDPVEITFTIDNVGLDLSDHEKPLGATLDLSGMSSGSRQNVSVTPENVDGATLNIEVKYQPSDLAAQPLDYKRALSEARCTFSERKQGMRITLPETTPAKVVIFDESGKKVVKAVKYISPMSIDISDMKKGKYNVAVEYGNAMRIFEIEI